MPEGVGPRTGENRDARKRVQIPIGALRIIAGAGIPFIFWGRNGGKSAPRKKQEKPVDKKVGPFFLFSVLPGS